MFNYGFGLEKGFLRTKDLEGAMNYYKMAADAGDTDGMVKYAVGLESGYLGTRDLKGSMKYYKMAADAGIAEGRFNYGYRLKKDIQEPKILKEQ
jgi:TPR repeat protein